MESSFVQEQSCIDLPVEVLQAYDLRVAEKMVFKDVFVLYTDRGVKCLKKVSYSEGELLFIFSAMEHLVQRGFTWLPRFTLAKNGKPFVKIRDGLYFLSDWVPGRESDFHNPMDVQLSAKTLAQFHLAARGFHPLPGSTIREEWGTWVELWGERLSHLLQMKEIAANRKEAFDHLFLKHVDFYYDLGVQALSALICSGYHGIVKEEQEVKAFCHHDYAYHNILIADENKCYVIDFDYCCYEIQCYDLGDFILRNLRRSSWQVEKAMAILDTYDKVKPIRQEEMKVLYSMFAFPQRFWRISDNYYFARKEHDEKYFCHKLRKVVQQRQNKKEFLRQFATLI